MRLAAALLLLTLVPWATGAADQGTFLGASYTLAAPVDPGSLEERTVRHGDAVGVSAPCGSDHIHLLPDGNGFRFSEAEDENGCAEAFFEASVPAGAQEHSVAFRADRIVQQSSPTGFPFAMVQALHLYGGDETDQPASTRTVFDPELPQQTPRADFSFRLETAPLEGGRTAFGFYFEDRGPRDADSALNPILGQWFRATVSDIRLLSTGIPLAHAVTEKKSIETGDAVHEFKTVSFEVTDRIMAAGDVSLHLAVSEGMELLVIRGPDDLEVPGYWVTVHHERGVVEATVAPDALVAHGSGNYTATFAATFAYEPVAAMVPVAAALFFLPVVAGVVADRAAGGLIRVRRSSHEGGMTSAVARWLLIPVGIVYMGIFLWVAIAGRWAVVTTLPLGLSGILVYGGLLLCLAGFLVLGDVIKRDVTRRLRREQRERQVLNDALQAAVAELERSNVELENFAYAASHDMQEPLRKIVNYSQLVDLRYRDVLDDEGREFLGISVDAGKRMQAFIQDLLDYSRITADDQEPEPLALDMLVDEVLEDLQEQVEETGASVQYGGLPTIAGRPGQLRRVVQNLLANALKYHSPDRPPRIGIRAREDGPRWRIVVEDNGVGVPAADRQRIFEPFRRGQDAAGRGSGLGLAMCKRIVERSGGTMGVEDAEEGSRFWFTWPKMAGNGVDAFPGRRGRPPRSPESPPQPR